jgi:erythromycin esterase-like protein
VRTAVLAFLAVLGPRSLPLRAQDTSAHHLLDSVVTANSRTLRLEHGILTGEGAAFLLNEAGSSRFVALGEQHNRIEIPELTTALFRALQANSGYQYLADERDPVVGRIVSSAPVRGRLDSVWLYQESL